MGLMWFSRLLFKIEDLIFLSFPSLWSTNINDGRTAFLAIFLIFLITPPPLCIFGYYGPIFNRFVNKAIKIKFFQSLYYTDNLLWSIFKNWTIFQGYYFQSCSFYFFWWNMTIYFIINLLTHVSSLKYSILHLESCYFNNKICRGL